MTNIQKVGSCNRAAVDFLRNAFPEFLPLPKFTPEWPFIFFTPIKSLYKNMLFTKISASNER